MTPTPEPVDDGNCTANEREIIRLCEQVMILSESLENCHKLVKFNSTTERDKVLNKCYAIVMSAIDDEGNVNVEIIHDKFITLRTPTPEAHR